MFQEISKLLTIGSRSIPTKTSLIHIPVRLIHSNRALVCRLKRTANEYTRLFPVRIVLKDGGTIMTRHHVPRQLIRIPLTLEDCLTEREKQQWHSRRKHKEVIKIVKDDIDVQFDRSQYLQTLMKHQSGR